MNPQCKTISSLLFNTLSNHYPDVQYSHDGHFPPNPFGQHPGQYSQQPPQQIAYPAILPAGPQQHQPYYAPLPAPQPPSEHPHPALQQPAQPHQYGRPIASPSPGHSGPGAPPPDLNSPSLSQYGDVANDGRRGGDEDEDAEEAQHDEVDGPDPVFHLPPPPEGTYSSEEALEEAIHSWSLEHGYELVRRASKKNAKGVLYKRYMHCSRHGKAANTGKLTEVTRQRFNRKSARINCPMSIAVVAIDPTNPDGEWQVRHRKTHHNHGPLDALNLAGHRRRARAGGIETAVDGLFAIGTPTAQVLQFLQRTNPHGLFTRTDVANMKLKYKKFGTCLVKGDTGSTHGRPCKTCRSRKIKCNTRRPICGPCREAGKACEYDHPPDGTEPTDPDPDDAADDTQNQVSEEVDLEQQPEGPARSNGDVAQFEQRAKRAEEILANLQAFQTQHVTPVKLDLQSSAVEVLAASSCGNGDSYRNVPVLSSVNDWPAFRDLMTEAAMKENTFEVLIATKTEPIAPPHDCKVEDWNEYIKKLAIFNRRNSALAGALWGRLAPSFRHRVQSLRKACEIWMVLEDACLPQGSENGFKLYVDLHSITQSNSADLKDYIVRLENAYTAFNRHSPHWRSQNEQQSQSSSRTKTGTTNTSSHPFSAIKLTHPASKLPPTENIFSEEMLCFLFLKNLSPDYLRWAEKLCSTNNVAGFGTGPRLGFVDITRRAVEFDIGRRGRAE